MGWLGWGEEQALNTSIPAILTAYDGRKDMLRAIFGGDEPEEPKPSKRTMTPQLFDALF